MGAQQERATIDLVINGRQGEATLKEITAATNNARSALYKMAETDPGYKQQKKDLEKLMATQAQRIVKINEEKTAWEKFKASGPGMVAGVAGGNLVSAGIQALSELPLKVKAAYQEFNAASQELSAVTGATGKDLAYLNKQASQTGPALGKSGAEMLEAYKMMASAKPELLSQKELLVETTQAALTLAQAGKIDLAEATKVTAESLNQFAEGADQANRFINVVAAGAKEGSAEINEMGMSLKASGTVAAAQNVSFEQTNAVLQSMSTIALKGEQAGTMLRNVLLTLGSGSDDTNPKVVGLDKALDNLAKKNLSTAEMTKLFGKENIVAAQHIITHRDQIEELTGKLTGTNEAYSQAAKNNETLEHTTEMFWAKAEGLAVSLGTRLAPAFSKAYATGTDLLTALPKLGSWLEKNAEWLLIGAVPALLAYNASMIKATISAVANTVAEGYRRAAYQAGFYWLVISETATKAYALATGVLTGQISLQSAAMIVLRNGWAALTAVMTANPFGLILVALGALTAASKYFSEHTQAALTLERQKQALQKRGLLDHELASKAQQDINDKLGRFNELSKIEQEELKKTIVLKQQETRSRLQNALARAREMVRSEGTKPTFWQGMKQGVSSLFTGNFGQDLDKRKADQLEGNKAATYAEAKSLYNVDQMKGDLEAFDRQLAQTNPVTKVTPTPTGGGSNGSGKKKKKKVTQADLDKDLAEARQRLAGSEDTEYQKDVAKFAAHYSQMYKTAYAITKDQEKNLTEIRRLSLLEWGGIEKKWKEEQLKNEFEQNEKKLEEFKQNAENRLELEVAFGKKTRQEADSEKLKLEEQYLTTSELLNKAYYKTLEEMAAGSAEKLKKVNSDKTDALLKIAGKLVDLAGKKKEETRKPVDKAYGDDLSDLESAHEKELLKIRKNAKSKGLTDAELKNAELSSEREFLKKKRQLLEQHYQLLSNLNILSADEKKDLDRDTKKEEVQLDGQAQEAEQQQYEGRLGKMLKFLDEKRQYMEDAATVLSAFFQVDQKKLDVGPLLDELDKLQHKTNLTSSEQERMKTIVSQVGQAMPSAVTGTNAYGEAISINTGKAREEVQAQKNRANVMHKIMLVQKAWALASVGISFGEAIMAAVAAGAKIPFPGNLLAIGLGVGKATLSNGAAIAKIMASNIEAPAFAEGGFTNTSTSQPSGYTSGPTYYSQGNFVAGEKGKEWIMSGPMLRNPVMANLANALQALQVSGDYKRLSYSQPSAASSNSGSSSDQIQLQILQELQMNRLQLQQNQQTMDNYAKKSISFDVLAFRKNEEYNNKVDLENRL